MDACSADEARLWQRRAERERQARLEAETIAENATRELYASNLELEAKNRQLAQTSQTLYRELFTHNPLPMYVVDKHTLKFVEVNSTAQRHYGFDHAEFLQMTLRDIEPVSTLDAGDARRAKLAPTQHDAGLWRHITRAGHSIDVELSIHSLQWADRAAWLMVARDVTVQHRDRRALELRTKAIESSHNGVFICSATDAEFPIVYLNQAMEALSGQTREALIDRPFSDLFAKGGQHEAARMVSALQAGHGTQAVIEGYARAGESLWLETQVTPVPDERGKIRHWIGVVQDITERKAFEATLEHRAHHDALTGLPNRVLLRQRLDAAIASAKRAGCDVAVLFLDFDNFKQINDIGGHDAGDCYLKTLARRLTDRIRHDDTLARVGGDEFVLVTQGTNLAEALPQLAMRIQDAFAEPVMVADQAFSAQCSIGIALCPEHGDDAETLLKRADFTMYTAKRKGGHAIEWFCAPMEASFRQRAEIEAALTRALANEEFEVHYQPQIDMRRGAVVGIEALLRWPNAPKACPGPADFIPVAEEIGLIGAIGDWVLERACRDLATLRGQSREPLTMSVNVSAMQLRESDFADKIAALLARYRLPPSALEIEITESVLMAEHDSGVAALRTLEAMGVRLAIDDFGTGYASLNYIRRIPIHRLKIDRSFIQDMGQSARAAELVRNVASMANNLKLEPVAEGVETDADMQTLLVYECYLAQGYHFSHALAIDQIAELIATKNASDKAIASPSAAVKPAADLARPADGAASK